MDKAKSSIIGILKEELLSVVNSLKERVQDLENKNSQLELRCQQMEEKSISGPGRDEDWVEEAMDRYQRRNFLIVSGLSEPSRGTVAERHNEDIQSLKTLFTELGAGELQVEEATRIGRNVGQRPKLLRLKCQSLDVKFDLLKRSKNLRKSAQFSNVYINPDLTKLQRQADKALRAELKQRRNNGEKVVIHRGRVIKAQDLKNFL